MAELLNPDQRLPKVTLLDDAIRVELGLRSLGNQQLKPLKIIIPAGEPAGLLVSFDAKSFVDDLFLSKADPGALKARLAARDKEHAAEDAALLGHLTDSILRHLTDGEAYAAIRPEADKLMRLYSNCSADVENGGHPFGGNLPPEDKKALTAYLATF